MEKDPTIQEFAINMFTDKCRELDQLKCEIANKQKEVVMRKYSLQAMKETLIKLGCNEEHLNYLF